MCYSIRTIYKDSLSLSTMNLKGESENSNSAIQLPSSACRIPVSMHVNPKVLKCCQLYPVRSRLSLSRGRRRGGWGRRKTEGMEG